MTGEARPVCVYALAGLKRNSSRLMIVMCVGIVLALYGVYVQARTQSNPNYMPTIAVATNWFYSTFGQRLVNPSAYLKGCMGSSGFVNGMINVGQIVLLKVYCKSLPGTDAIIGLSSFGLLVSMICLVGSFATCKLMCISCLGIHHMVIIYLALKRRRVLKNILCPTENLGACTFGTGTSGGGGGASSSTVGATTKSNPNSISNQKVASSSSKHASTCTTRRRPEASDRRRSDRI